MGAMQTGMSQPMVMQIDRDLAYTGEQWWLVMLQHELERLKKNGVAIGAHVTQLGHRVELFMNAVMSKARGAAVDRMAMLRAVLQMFEGEETNEAVDVADAWAEEWTQYLQYFLLPRGEASINEDAVLLDDSQVDNAEVAEDSAAQAVASLQRQIMRRRTEARQAARQRRLAEAERSWDDWAVFIEMNKAVRYKMRSRSFVVKDEVRDIGTQTEAPHEDGQSEARSSHEACPTRREELVDDEDTEEWPPGRGRKRPIARASSFGAPPYDAEMLQNDQGGVDAAGDEQDPGHDCVHNLNEGIAGVDLNMARPAFAATLCDEGEADGDAENHHEADVLVLSEGPQVVAGEGDAVLVGENEASAVCGGSEPPGPSESGAPSNEH